MTTAAQAVRNEGAQRAQEVSLVTVIMAVRNEEPFIASALRAVCVQDYPRERMEIVVADGASTDRTRAIVREIAERDGRVRLIDNPRRIVAPGLNAAIAAAQGTVIVRVDGHCQIPENYVSTCVNLIYERDAQCAGGPLRSRGRTPMARAIALAMSTPFGAGGSAYLCAKGDPPVREVDHLPMGCWRREVFERIGGFDEQLVRNQDDELSDRLKRSGGRILMDLRIPVIYWSRGTLAGLWRQYHGYGYWKVRVIRKRGGRPSALRHLVPAVFVTILAGSLLAAVFAGLWQPLTLVGGAYLAFLATATLWLARGRHGATVLLLPAAMAVMQTAYGVGFLQAVVTGWRGSTPERRSGTDVA